jgi:hypothetical protein
MGEKWLTTLRLKEGALTADVPPEETEELLATLARLYGKYWIAYVKDDTGRLWSWAYGGSREEARDGLILEGFAEYMEARGEREVTYELVVTPPRRAVVQ